LSDWAAGFHRSRFKAARLVPARGWINKALTTIGIKAAGIGELSRMSLQQKDLNIAPEMKVSRLSDVQKEVMR
jgi:hypothetical protein